MLSLNYLICMYVLTLSYSLKINVCVCVCVRGWAKESKVSDWPGLGKISWVHAHTCMYTLSAYLYEKDFNCPPVWWLCIHAGLIGCQKLVVLKNVFSTGLS